MIRKISIPLIFFVVSFVSGFAEPGKTDSLLQIIKHSENYSVKIEALKHAADIFFANNNYPEVVKLSEQGIKLSTDNSDLNSQYDFLKLSGASFLYLSDLEKSLKTYQTLYNIANDKNNEKCKGIALTGFVKNYWRLGEYEKAIIYADKALKIFEKIGDKKNQNIVLLNIANIYLDVKDYKSAEKLFDTLLEESIKNSDTLLTASLYEKKGVIKFYKSLYPLARKYYEEAYGLYIKKGDILSAAIQTGNIGETYEMEGKYKKAINMYKKAIKTEYEFDYYSGLIFLYEATGRLYMKLNNYRKSEEYLLKAFFQIKLTEENRELPNIYEMLYNVYSKNKNYKKAFEYAVKTQKIKDSLTNENVKTQINKIRINYETEKKEHENKLLKIKQKQQRKENRRQSGIISGILFFSFFLILFAVLLFQLNKKNRKIKQTLAVKNKKLNKVYKDLKGNIEYAGKIQNAMLLSYSENLKFFEEFVILYRPATTLSGDFYWSKKIKDTIFVAVADSTGHGIPGALLSITGMSFLDDTVSEDYIQPDVILNNLRSKIKIRLNQKGDFGNFHEHKDGWDMSLFSFNIKTFETVFAGAYNSMYVVKNDPKGKKIVQYKADRQPVAVYCIEKPFSRHKLRLKKGDIIWMFTDGYADQFNPEIQRKFTVKKLKNILLSISDLPLKEQKNLLKKEFKNWQSSFEQVDDVLIMGIKI